jgi:hypothetical protein
MTTTRGLLWIGVTEWIVSLNAAPFAGMTQTVSTGQSVRHHQK